MIDFGNIFSVANGHTSFGPCQQLRRLDGVFTGTTSVGILRKSSPDRFVLGEAIGLPIVLNTVRVRVYDTDGITVILDETKDAGLKAVGDTLVYAVLADSGVEYAIGATVSCPGDLSLTANSYWGFTLGRNDTCSGPLAAGEISWQIV